MTKYTDFLTESFGRVILVATDCGLSHIIFSDIIEFESKRAKFAIIDVQHDDERFKSVIEMLRRYFAGERVEFTNIPIDLSNCRPFQRDALNVTRQVPYGEVKTYKWIAECLGKPKASRAVGQAMAHNLIPIIVPCHRIIGSSGSLTGYGLGLAMKRQLLTMERAIITKQGTPSVLD